MYRYEIYFDLVLLEDSLHHFLKNQLSINYKDIILHCLPS